METSCASLSVRALSKSFGAAQPALDHVSLELQAGEMVALIGASGSGKSTLLRHVAGFVAADPGGGEVRVGANVMQAGGRVDRRIRRLREDVGFVFQQFNLVGRLSVITNVLVGLLPRVPWWRSTAMRFTAAETEEALGALRRVGIEGLAWQRASTLSGGQQQRVAIARALVNEPTVLLADEPTGNLDERATRGVFQLLRDINASGTAVVMATHDLDLVRQAPYRVIELQEGALVYDSGVDEPRDQAAST